MKSKDSAVRYWGAMGYLIRGKNGLRKGRKILHNALKDESPSVRIIAAESLGKFGNIYDKPKIYLKTMLFTISLVDFIFQKRAKVV